MRSRGAFALGAVVGAAGAWLWGRQIEEYVAQKTRRARKTVAEGVREIEEKAMQVLDRGGDALRRADDFLQDTKVHVSAALRAGEDAIRPAPTSQTAYQERRAP